MIGQKSFEINANDFLKGISSSDFMNDGGMSSVCAAANIYNTPGLLYGCPPVVDQTDDLTDELVASCDDPRVYTSGAYTRIFVDNAGNYYGWNGTLLDLLDTDATNPTEYAFGKVDMIGFGENTVYTTNGKAISSLVPSTGAVTDEFYVFAGSYGPVVPHPALVYENNAYYGNGNTLLRQTAPGATPAVILTLPVEQTIVALGIDPGSGKMLLSIINGLNLSDTLNKKARVGYYDGFSNKLLKVVLVDEMITCFYPCGSTLYVFYGQDFGYWTGSGISFLRRLNVSLQSASLPYKHHVTNINTTIYMIEGSRILAYGQIAGRRQKVFYPILTQYEPTTAGDLTASLTILVNLGSNFLGYCFADKNAVEKFYTVEISSVASIGTSLTVSQRWRSNKYIFSKPVTLNAVQIEYGVALPTDDSVVGTLTIFDDNQTASSLDGVTGIHTTVANTYQVTRVSQAIKTRSLQLSYTFAAQYPVRRFTVFYTPNE